MMQGKRVQQSKKNKPPPPDTTKKNEPGCVDLLLIHDCTASQTPYISGTVRRCLDMIEVIQDLGKIKPEMGLRVGLIAFRDHQEDEDYVTKDFGGFTNDIEKVIDNLQSLEADGGADFPEAVTAALAHGLRLDWRDDASKLLVLVTDAAPHGIGEDNDDYQDGDPNDDDPLKLARQMAKRGIKMLIVACEPTLSNDNKYAHDFYAALARITLGKMIPLTDTRTLTPVIIGFALEQLGLDTLATQYMDSIQELNSKGWSLKQLTHIVWSWLSPNEKIFTLRMNDIYTRSPEFDKTVEEWVQADNILSVREKIWKGTTVRKRVALKYIQPTTGWPKTYVSITLKNLGDCVIDYQYRDPDPDINRKDEGKMGSLKTGEILKQKKFLAHTYHHFKFKSGSTETSFIAQNFNRDKDWELSKYFN